LDPTVPKPFDLLASASEFARESGIPLNDPTFVESFLAAAKARLEAALADSTLLHGSRAERLFESTVLSLGHFMLLKTEDGGRVHSARRCRAPDFRVVLDDGEQWLVEVKNVRCEDPFKQRTTMSAAYVASLEAYSRAVGSPLRIAIYWSRWSLWTIIAPDTFRRRDGGLSVRMRDALMVNEFVRLGEVSIATRPPLRFVLRADREKPRTVNAAGEARFVIGSVHIFSGEVELLDARDRRLAEILFFYGDWPMEGPFAVLEGDQLIGAEYVAEPPEPSNQGFDGIGWASRIFSRYFAIRTMEGDAVIQLRADAVPEWFAPLASWPFGESKLPLWLISVRPSPEALEAAQKSLDVSARGKSRPHR
jgi:hypothetical protein